MDMVSLLFIALGLAMDALAGSIANGMRIKNGGNANALKMAISFGSFQAFMPMVGWAAGLGLSVFISGIDHWMAFGLLGFIGCKMIYESLRVRVEAKEVKALLLLVLLVLSVATSIDALTVGLSFAFLQVSIALPVVVIGSVTFVLSFLGVSFGSKLGGFLKIRLRLQMVSYWYSSA